MVRSLEARFTCRHQQDDPTTDWGEPIMPEIPVSLAPGAMNVKTHCIHGHSLDDAYITTHFWRGKKRVMRICCPCQIERAAKQRQKKKVNTS